MLIPKTKPIRDKAHLELIREMPCLIDSEHSQETVVPHHLTFRECGGGMSSKSGDNFTVPLCYFCHIEQLHKQGETSFWNLNGYSREQIITLAQDLYKGDK